jgi:hypothetical protein
MLLGSQFFIAGFLGEIILRNKKIKNVIPLKKKSTTNDPQKNY